MKISVKCVAVVAFAMIMSTAVLTNAQATRTWVSGVGDDVNPCSRTAPCKTFAGAISKTAEDGEINCLDPAGFGAVTITKSITIDCTGTLGGILASLTTGIIVNVTSATDVRKAVVLRGLEIQGAGNGIYGVRVIGANSLTIEDTIIDGFSSHGIYVESPAGPKIVINNSSIRNNAGQGINVYTTGLPSLQIAHSSIINNTLNGLNLAFLAKGSIRDSTITGNSTGILAYNSDFSVINSSISGNVNGLETYTGGTLRISGLTVSGNTNGLVNTGGGTIISSGNNTIGGNGTNGSPNSTVVLQ